MIIIQRAVEDQRATGRIKPKLDSFPTSTILKIEKKDKTSEKKNSDANNNSKSSDFGGEKKGEEGREGSGEGEGEEKKSSVDGKGGRKSYGKDGLNSVSIE